MNTKHTPGPWKILMDSTSSGAWPFIVRGEDKDTDLPIADLGVTHLAKNHLDHNDFEANPDGYKQHEDHDEIMANARLISAAPELLEALEEYALGYSDADLEILANTDSGRGEIGPEAAKREIKRRAAIAKATGKEGV